MPEQKQTNGHVPPPETGWKGDIPSKEGGSEVGYLMKPPYVWKSKEFKVAYTAACWCGKVEIEYHGDPVGAVSCHCKQCQSLHGAPFQWAVHYHKTSVRLAEHCDPLNLQFFSTQTRSTSHTVPCKAHCFSCKSPLFDEGKSMIMAYPSSFRFPNRKVPHSFAPTAHIFYGERVMNLDDDIPKWEGHKGKSERMPHAPRDVEDRTYGKEKGYKSRENGGGGVQEREMGEGEGEGEERGEKRKRKKNGE